MANAVPFDGLTREQLLALIAAAQAALDSMQSAPPPVAPPHPIASMPNIDPFFPALAPLTEYQPITHHVLSLPDTYIVNGTLTRHEPLESIDRYAWRVSDQCHAGGDMGSAYQIDARNSIGLGYGIGAPVVSTQTIDGESQQVMTNGPVLADKSNWPAAVDWYFNRRAILAVNAPKQLARELAAEQAQKDAWARFHPAGT